MQKQNELKKCKKCKCAPVLKVENLCFISDKDCAFEKRYYYKCKCGIKTPFTYETEEEARREWNQKIIRYDYKFVYGNGRRKNDR